MISALGSAVYATASQMTRFEQSAERVARSGQVDYVQETVEQMSVEHTVKADVAVIKTADALTGALLDIVA